MIGPASLRHRRGFSLLDVAVGVTLFVALFVAGLTFILSLNRAAETSFARSQLRRQVVAARSALEADLAQAAPCGGGMATSAFLEFRDPDGTGADSMLLWVDADQDGRTDLVGWRVEGETLERAWKRNTSTSTAPDAGCADLAAAGIDEQDWRKVLGGVRYVAGPNNDLHFQGVRDGRPDYHQGSCVGVDTGSCDFDAVAVRLVAEPSAAAGPALVDSTFNVADTPSG
jgi:type II secretory pathway component PulJ